MRWRGDLATTLKQSLWKEGGESVLKYYVLAFRSVLLIILLCVCIMQYAQKKAIINIGIMQNFQNNIKAVSLFFKKKKVSLKMYCGN